MTIINRCYLHSIEKGKDCQSFLLTPLSPHVSTIKHPGAETPEFIKSPLHLLVSLGFEILRKRLPWTNTIHEFAPGVMVDEGSLFTMVDDSP